MKILQNIRFALLTTLLFVIPDQIFKFFNENISIMFETQNHKQIFWLFVISFIFSFAKSKKV